jgi:peptidyl-prolyl cis-trans isomerase C
MALRAYRLRRLARALAPLAVAGAIAGCGSDAGVLARVNQQPITIEQFNEVAAGNLGQYIGAPDSVKATLLDDLVNRELLVQAARSEGIDRTPEFQNFRRNLEQQVLREAMFQRLMSGPFPVSDAEVRALYELRNTATHARLIFTYDESVARLAAENLARGEAFETVADRYNPTGMVPPGGDVGFIQPGALLPPLDEMVRTGTPGKILGPIKVGSDGWFLVRIEGRRPQPQPPFEEVRPQLTEMLRQRKQRVIATRVVDRLRTEYAIELQPGAAQVMSDRLRPAPGEGLAGRPPAPGPEDRQQVLARYAGGTYTLGEAYDDLVAGSANRLDLAVIPSVERWIQLQTIERASLLEARRRRIDEEPEVLRRVRERINNTLLDAFYQRHVVAAIQLAPEDLRAAYERYRTQFARLTSAHVVSVTLPDSAAAATLAVQTAHTQGLREAASAAGLGGQVREDQLTFPAESPLWTQFESHLSAMRPGQAAGPFETPNGWLLLQLLDKRQDAPAFEALPASAHTQLQGVALEIKREARLAALTDSLRRVLGPVVVHEERLRRVPWPPAATPPAGS